MSTPMRPWAITFRTAKQGDNFLKNYFTVVGTKCE